MLASDKSSSVRVCTGDSKGMFLKTAVGKSIDALLPSRVRSLLPFVLTSSFNACKDG